MRHPFNDDLQSVLDSPEAYAFLPSGTWMEGGCALLAESLQQLIPSSALKVIGRPSTNGPCDHVVLELALDGETVYLDFDGLQTLEEMTEKARSEWNHPEVVVGDFDANQLEDVGVRWLAHAVSGITSFLRKEMGPVNQERLSLAWADHCAEAKTEQPKLEFVKDKELWKADETAYFEYHCSQSHDSQDADLWYRSHQEVKIVKVAECDGTDWLEDGFESRMEEAVPIAYAVEFSDGHRGTAFEDELFTSPKAFCDQGAPPPLAEINRIRAQRLESKLPSPAQATAKP